MFNVLLADFPILKAGAERFLLLILIPLSYSLPHCKSYPFVSTKINFKYHKGELQPHKRYLSRIIFMKKKISFHEEKDFFS